jgi:hypothetical protein
MRYSITLLAAVLIFFGSQRIQAQQVIMSSSLTRDATTGEMVGLSRTEMDVNTASWYQSYVYNEIRRQSDNALLASGETYSVPGTNRVAERISRTPGVANTTYRLDSKHWILPSSTYWCTFSLLDRYSFTQIGPPFIGGNYGATQTFFGYDPGYISGACVGGWIYLGQTTQSKTIPGVTITNPRIGSVPAQSTQSALVGADVSLSSTVTQAGGTYSWTFTGPYSISGGGSSSSSVTIRSSDTGTITARLTYTLNGIPQSQQFSINVITPTLQSFTAQQGRDFVTTANQCNSPDTFTWYRLGCIPPQDVGMVFSTQVNAPVFMSNPAQSGIKFVQAVSGFRKWTERGLRCTTIRTSDSDVESGWQLDFADPYDPGGYPPKFFSEGNSLTMTTVDYPKESLTFATPQDFKEALFVDDQFWMYVIYFAGNDIKSPFMQRPIGRLRWNWGGLVVFDPAGSNFAHNLRSTTTIPQTRTGEPATSTVTMQGVVSKTAVPCPGGPPITDLKIDSSRFLVKWYYLDILGRSADAGGWDWHTSSIAQCVLDWNCIPMKRSNEALGFFFSQEFIQISQDSIMANPPGSPNFNAAAYNPRFIIWCYRIFLRREPDPDGFNYWLNILNSEGNYGRVVFGFIYSPEYRSRPFA